MYTACNAHAPYCHLWPVRVYKISSHYLINARFSEEKKLLNVKCVLIFSTNFVWNISHSKKNWAKCGEKYLFIFISCTQYSCQILMKLKFARQIFEKYENFMKISSVGAELFHADWLTDGRTDGPTDMTKLIVAFLNFANAPKSGAKSRWNGKEETVNVKKKGLAQLCEALHYKPEGRGFDSRWGNWEFSFTHFFRPHFGPGVDSAARC
jgi:hypothetical protein